MAAPKKVNYELLEPGWRAGVFSPGQLAAQYTQDTGVKISHAAIINHFKKLGVPRDLGAKVRQKADAMVMESMVSGKVSLKTNKNDAQVIEGVALQVANVQVAERNDIVRARRLCMTLLSELETQTGNLPGLEDLGEMLRQPNENGADRLNDIYRAVISLPERTKTIKALAETMKHLIALEREAYGLSTPPPTQNRSHVEIPDDPVEASRAYQRLMLKA